MDIILMASIPIILLGLLVAFLIIHIIQRKKNEAEEEQAMDELREQVENEKKQEGSNAGPVPSQLLLLLTEIKNSNEQIEKDMNFFKTLATVAIVLGIIIAIINIINM